MVLSDKLKAAHVSRLAVNPAVAIDVSSGGPALSLFCQSDLDD